MQKNPDAGTIFKSLGIYPGQERIVTEPNNEFGDFFTVGLRRTDDGPAFDTSKAGTWGTEYVGETLGRLSKEEFIEAAKRGNPNMPESWVEDLENWYDGNTNK